MTTLEEWNRTVKPHLDFIAAGAEMAARHARMLPVRGDWRSLSQDELEATRKVLETALAKIIAAEVHYETTPVEQSRAA